MKKILLVVDYQNDFVSGTLGFEGAKLLDSEIAEKISQYTYVYATLDTHEDDYLSTREGKHLPVIHCVKNTPGWEVFEKTGAALKEKSAVMIEKKSFGISLEDMINILPSEHEVASVEIVGLVTNICVISCAILCQTKYPDIEITVNGKLCASFDKSLHEKTLDILEGLQFSVIR